MIEEVIEKIICVFKKSGRNCPLENEEADPNTFCEAYKQQDSYICKASAIKYDPVEDF